MNSLETHLHIYNKPLVIVQSSKLLLRRSKSDSEIYFHTLSALSKKEGKLKSTKNYGTLKLETGNLQKNKFFIEFANYDGRKSSRLMKYRNNTLPRCPKSITNNHTKRSNSLPSTVKFTRICEEDDDTEILITDHLNTNENGNENDESEVENVEESSSANHCSGDDEQMFMFNAVLAQQQQNVMEMNRPRQYGRRMNSPRNNVRLSDESEHSQNSTTNRADDELNQNPDILPNNFNLSSNSSTSSSTTASQINRHDNSSFLSQSPRLEAMIRDIGPRFIQQQHQQSERSNHSNEGWPSSISRPVTSLFCCIGLFNFSRFAISSVIYGGNFLIQFVILSIIFGIPFLLLQMVLGQRIKGGIVTIYKISPICKGIGISLLISHCIFCLYSSVSIGWMMIYLRNFLTTPERSKNHHDDNVFAFNEYKRNHKYLSNIQNESQHYDDYSYTLPTQNRFQFALFCCLIWTCTFIALSRGKKSLSVVTLVITIFSYVGILLINLRFLIMMDFKPINALFSNTNWQDFFANSNSWFNAAQETFLTWGLLGVSILTIYKRKSDSNNNNSTNDESNGISFKKEISLIVVLTFIGLFLSAILGSICLMIIKSRGYTTTSIGNNENLNNTKYLTSVDEEWINRYNCIIGEVSIRRDFVYKKMLRLVTEFMPWTLAAISDSEPVWGLLFFSSLIFLGLAQNCVMWRPVSTLVGHSSSAVLLSCGSALLLMFPLTTDEGRNIVEYLDFIFGGAWHCLLLWALYFISIFIIRGRPYTSDNLVKDLKFNSLISGYIAFSWSFMMPIGLILLTILNYRKSNSRILFAKRNFFDHNLSYWPQWSLRLGGFFQIALICIVPLVAIYELYYHLTKGPRDILERVELLFRPPIDEPNENYLLHLPLRRVCNNRTTTAVGNADNHRYRPQESANNQWNNDEQIVVNDQPPNYSPPPSYGRAIGARIASTLRNSYRRSIRGIKKMRKQQQQQDPNNVLPPYSNIENSASVSSVQTIFNNHDENISQM